MSAQGKSDYAKKISRKQHEEDTCIHYGFDCRLLRILLVQCQHSVKLALLIRICPERGRAT